MKQLFAAHFTMVEACINTAESYADDWAGFEGFSQPFGELKELVPQMITALGITAQRIAPATQAKRGLRDEIEAATLCIAGALAAYSLKTRDDNLRSEAYLKASHLKLASGNGVVSYATHRLALAQALPADVLAPWGYTSDALSKFAEQTKVFALALSKPRDRRLEIKSGRETAESLMQDALRLLNDALDSGVRILAPEHRAFSAQWKAARKVIQPGHRTRSLAIAVSDAASGAPVTGASIAILPAGMERVSTAKGNTFVQNLVAGAYTARVSHKDYGLKEVPFEVRPGETTVLAVVLDAAA